MIGSWYSERVARAPTNGKCKAKNKRNKRTRVKNRKAKNNPSSEKINKIAKWKMIEMIYETKEEIKKIVARREDYKLVKQMVK